MKRERWTAGLLAAMLLGSLWNLKHLDGLIERIEDRVTESQAAAEAGSNEQALSALSEARDIWLQASGYTEIFLRHPEIDAVSDAFYELEQQLRETKTDAAPGYAKLLYHLKCIDQMEHPRLGSVL